MEAEQPESLCHVRCSEAFPKATLQSEDPRLSVAFCLLAGEAVSHLGRTQDGCLALSNYRLHLSRPGAACSVPLGLVEAVEVKDLTSLAVGCKDARSVRLSFSSNEQCLTWLRRLLQATAPPSRLEDTFAFAFHAWACDDDLPPPPRLGRDLTTPCSDLSAELERLGFDLSGAWRVSLANVDYALCPSYPRRLLVPASVSDAALESAARFRSARRVPAVVWRHPASGAVIARSSQPEVGWLGWRSAEDEALVAALAEACGSRRLLIVDARSYATAVANRARGGGCECPEYYPRCDVAFMGLPNIHAVRKSFHALRALCAGPPDPPSWPALLDATRWLHHLSGLLRAAVTVAAAVHRDGRPVLVHCSDGWDRTPQVVGLAEILLDPYYRTIEGFRVLVEREWLAFGHKFWERHGQADDPNERCPVFLQWLDCVWQLARQFPCAFEFRPALLAKLAQHSFSNLFGTFLCNSDSERQAAATRQRTFSVWCFLRAERFQNQLYSGAGGELWPACHVRDLALWAQVYLGGEETGTGSPLGGKTRSCDDLAGRARGAQRRSSDPSLSLDLGDECESSTDTLVPVCGSVNGIVGAEDLDGLPPLGCPVQARVEQLVAEHRAREEALQRELYATRMALLRQVCHPDAPTEQPEDAEELSEPASAGESIPSDVSWEAVEEGDAGPTLWVPDHAVSRCMGCDTQFWMGRRKHHCRSCGKIFCADCSENALPLPEEQLYDPVRVCGGCFQGRHTPPYRTDATA